MREYSSENYTIETLKEKWFNACCDGIDEPDLNVFIVEIYNLYHDNLEELPKFMSDVLSRQRWTKEDFIDNILWNPKNKLELGDIIEITRNTKNYKEGDRFRVIKDCTNQVEIISEKTFDILKVAKITRFFRRVENG